MPLPQPVGPNYDSLKSVLQLGRARMNDAIASINGDILTDAQPFTYTMIVAAWREFQAYLANLGYSRFKKPLLLTAFPPVANLDPASWTSLDWSGYFDGAALWVPPAVGVLPSDWILPLRIWERQTGTASQFSNDPMEMAVENLPFARKGPFNQTWLWENDTLYMPGSLYSMDFRFEYAAYLPDFLADPNGVLLPNQTVPVVRARNPLAWYFCAEAAEGRDDVDKATFIANAEKDCRFIFNREVAMKQRRPVSRRCYSSHRSSVGIW